MCLFVCTILSVGMSVQGVCVKGEAETIRRILELFRTVGNFGKLLNMLFVAGNL